MEHIIEKIGMSTTVTAIFFPVNNTQNVVSIDIEINYQNMNEGRVNSSLSPPN
jgi:hypothetical protein